MNITLLHCKNFFFIALLRDKLPRDQEQRRSDGQPVAADLSEGKLEGHYGNSVLRAVNRRIGRIHSEMELFSLTGLK